MESDYLALRNGNRILGDAVSRPEGTANLNKDIAGRIGYAFALWLAERLETSPDRVTIAVGRDPRVSSGDLALGVMQGVTSADCDALDCGISTTPAVFALAAGPDPCDGAVMITASHHPWYKNGIKFTAKDGGLDAEDVEVILKSAASAALPMRLVRQADALEPYQARLADMIRTQLEDDAKMPLLGLHVVVDAGNGSGGFFADFLENLGAYVDGSIGLAPDGLFPGHAPNPRDPEALRALSDAVLANEADMGLLFDVDCERVAIVDQDGKIIERNRLIALIAAIVLEERPGATIVTDSVTSSGVARFISEWGGVHYRYKRGHRNVIDEAIRLNEEGIDCPLAIETSGHAAMRENYFLDDGAFLATRILCETMKRKREGLTLSSLIEELDEPVERVELRLSVTDPDAKEAGQSVIETVLSHTLDDPNWFLAPDNREGMRISFDLDGGVDNAWFLLRLSIQDPVMPLYAESDVPGGIARIFRPLYELLAEEEAPLDLAPLRDYLDHAE